MKMNYQILLFYNYVLIKNPEKFKYEHQLFCVKNNIKGRIIISREGINGTVSGLTKDCQNYIQELNNKFFFSSINFKVENYHKNVFNKINVRVKEEIVNSGLTDKSLLKKKGDYINSSDFQEIIKKKSNDITILDVRSNYEHNIGKFKNALTLDIDNFRDFPKKINELKKKIKKSNKIITYCTGGVKCEKASAFLKENGYENVYQLHGGIIKYGYEKGGKYFDGKCYVFDDRIVKDVNIINPKIVGKCLVNGEKTDRMVNCANALCNKHFPLSKSGAIKYKGCCSLKCLKNGDIRKYDGTGVYKKKLNGYNPYTSIQK